MGFNSLSHFNVAFKKQYGFTSSELITQNFQLGHIMTLA